MLKPVVILLLLFSISWAQDSPMGFASLAGGTTGGAGGDTVFVTTAQQLADIMKPREKNVTDPIVIFISDTLTGCDDMLDIKRTANVCSWDLIVMPCFWVSALRLLNAVMSLCVILLLPTVPRMRKTD